MHTWRELGAERSELGVSMLVPPLKGWHNNPMAYERLAEQQRCLPTRGFKHGCVTKRQDEAVAEAVKTQDGQNAYLMWFECHQMVVKMGWGGGGGNVHRNFR